ncbi:hypothetical protein [Nocardioides sp. CFH 31398]|uniref:hypothetical protein n=1 Tax=Nocardioides sp. CFH 31398 TaxID=2919579 RepID=UPI001F05C42D|nr:hypothetical protein [Nocardioides sp. CFH 31398]MCH1867125.1 hypothetical protein [Nocardioides sp. CFH 31398]
MMPRLASAVVAALVAGLLAAPGPAASARGLAESVRSEGGGGRVKDLDLFVPRGYADQRVDATVRLLGADGRPDAGQRVRLQRFDGRSWQLLAARETGEDGRVSRPVTLRRRAELNRFRVKHTTPTRTLTTRRDPALLRRTSRVTLFGQKKLRDGRSMTLRLSWATGQGERLRGKVRLERDTGSGWRAADTLKTSKLGKARVRVRPRVDTRFRAVGLPSSWFLGDTSNEIAVDNLPPGDRVRLPAGAPAPRRALPAQPRAVGRGANAVATYLPDDVWNDMVGVSWRRGCPVGRSGLRLVRTNYWGFDGYRYRGQLVVNADVVGRVLGVVRGLYAAELPVRRMYRVDRFGYSSRLRGANGFASMAADNTSAFNCRGALGRPRDRAVSATGRSIEMNPWENPSLTPNGWVPDDWWVGRAHPRVAWRSTAHPVVRVFARHGFRWRYGTFTARR